MPYYVIVFFIAFFAYGCSSRIPEPTTFPYSQQQKMEASYHWQVLADDLASRINNELITSDNINRSVFVKETCGDEAKPCGPNETSTFNEAFRDLLITNLVNYGIPTQKEKNDDSLEVLYKVQIVRHNTERIRSLQPGVLTAISGAIVVLRDASSKLVTLALGAGLDLANTSLTLNGHYEIIITTSMISADKYVFRASDIYYINDKDFWQYQDQKQEAKTLKLTSSEQGRSETTAKTLPKPPKSPSDASEKSGQKGQKEI